MMFATNTDTVYEHVICMEFIHHWKGIFRASALHRDSQLSAETKGRMGGSVCTQNIWKGLILRIHKEFKKTLKPKPKTAQ
jgi:hypothetical protein